MSRWLKTSLAALLVGVMGVAVDALYELGQGARPNIAGIVWQPDNATVGIQGEWQKLGAHELLVQWTAVDGQAFVPGSGLPEVPALPDWARIAKAPWAQDVIVGLAGFFSENRSRDNIEELATLSEQMARVKTPLNVTGWYFPAEVDPSWSRAKELPALLARLPRPLWISTHVWYHRAPTSVYVQVPGSGLKIGAALFEKELARSASMRAVMHLYVHAFFNQVAQSAACNQFHTLEQRCARWLLMTHDRMQEDEFLLTQEFLAMMLGVQRTGVTLAAGALQRAGLITYARGKVTVIDRAGLARRACECYGVSKREFDRLLRVRAVKAHHRAVKR